MTLLQLLGMIIPCFILLFIYGWSIKECNRGNGDKPTPTWVGTIMFISCLVLGFTIGTLIP